MSISSAIDGTAEDNRIALPRQAADPTAAVSSGKTSWLDHDMHDCMCKALHPNLEVSSHQFWKQFAIALGTPVWAFRGM